MCVVSNIGSYQQQQWNQQYPGLGTDLQQLQSITRVEFDALKNQVEQLKTLLEAAQKYDKATGQSECENEEKVALIRAVAKMVGVDLGSVFGEAK